MSDGTYPEEVDPSTLLGPALMEGQSTVGYVIIGGNDFRGQLRADLRSVLDTARFAHPKVRIEQVSRDSDTVIRVSAFETDAALLSRWWVYTGIARVTPRPGAPLHLLKLLPQDSSGGFFTFFQDSLILTPSLADDSSTLAASIREIAQDSLVLVVWVQDPQTKRVYQARAFSLWGGILTRDADNGRRPGPSPVFPSDPYPNPTSGPLTLQLPEPLATEHTVRIHTLEGRRVRQWSVPAETDATRPLYLDLSGLSAGVYLLRVYAEGQPRWEGKVVLRPE